MKCESTQRPPEFAIVRDNDVAIISFAVNVQKVTRTENETPAPRHRRHRKSAPAETDVVVAEENDIEQREVFEYDRYEFKTTYRDTLAHDIASNYDAWLNLAIESARKEKANAIRAKRNTLLDESDKEVTYDRMLEKYGAEVVSDPEKLSQLPIFKYREALRNITLQETFPESVVFPEMP